MIWICFLVYLLSTYFVLHAASESQRRQQEADHHHQFQGGLLNDSAPVFQLDPKFPNISVIDVIRGLSPHGYRGDVKRVHAALNKALQKKYLSVIVLGGSVPYGAGLEPNTYRDCWPTQLRHMLRTIFEVKVNVNNLSIRAVSSDAQATSRFNYISSHITKDVDLVLVDIGLNDKPHTDPEFREHVAYFEEAGQVSFAVKEAALLKERKKQGEGRLLMQLLLRFVPSTTAIIYFETFAGGGKTAPIIHSVKDLMAAQKQGFTDGVYDFEAKDVELDCYPDVGRYYHFQALVEYKIPVFSYPDVVCPIHNKSYWGGNMHHSKEYHHFTASLIALAIVELARSDISQTKFDTILPYPQSRIKDWNDYIYDRSTDTKLKLDSKLVVCIITPLSYMAVNRPKRFTPVRKGSAWRFYKDVSDKPGWIANAYSVEDEAALSEIITVKHDKSRDIVFPITLSTEQPMLRLSFLRSYNQTMGKLSCCISSNQKHSICAPNASTYVFDGHWSDPTSQAVAVAVAVHLSTIRNPSPPPRSSRHPPLAESTVDIAASSVVRNLVCTADKGKFKIIGVVGC